MENGSPTPPIVPDISEGQKLFQEYLQATCEEGQLRHALRMILSQTKEIEKKLELAEKKTNGTAQRHREAQSKGLAAVSMPPPKEPVVEASH